MAMTAQEVGKNLAESGRQKLRALLDDVKIGVEEPFAAIFKTLAFESASSKDILAKQHLLSEEELKEANLPTEGMGPTAGSSGPGL
ncbi:MAG TPA: hypothetical protein VHE99_05705 [Gammaproteobacteria bacterium]|nr:hypothetical protein [Gammaproteobacteria bacterium]